jgi:hypothetical protein
MQSETKTRDAAGNSEQLSMSVCVVNRDDVKQVRNIPAMYVLEDFPSPFTGL